MSNDTDKDWYTLVNVQKTHANGRISGSFIQNHFGTLISAKAAAYDTLRANSNAIDVAIIVGIAYIGSYEVHEKTRL